MQKYPELAVQIVTAIQQGRQKDQAASGSG
jgi:hypothetical protein